MALSEDSLVVTRPERIVPIVAAVATAIREEPLSARDRRCPPALFAPEKLASFLPDVSDRLVVGR